jgi:myo-inositol-1-phosphate synthase
LALGTPPKDGIDKLEVADLESKIERNVATPSSVLFCVAGIEEQVLYLNGSPQNTFHAGVAEYAKEHESFIAGSDFKSGQTRFKTIMCDYLTGAGCVSSFDSGQ